VHNTLIGAPAEPRDGIAHRIAAMVAGASPPPSTIEALERINIELMHTYGLTEVYGPATVCTKQEEWAALDPHDQAIRNGRPGVPYLIEEDAAVLDPDRMEPVAADGETIGEIVFRGSTTSSSTAGNSWRSSRCRAESSLAPSRRRRPGRFRRTSGASGQVGRGHRLTRHGSPRCGEVRSDRFGRRFTSTRAFSGRSLSRSGHRTGSGNDQIPKAGRP
jgi:acyl-CoA synthetase (AMP-forming)/AMP-acid ligase II